MLERGKQSLVVSWEGRQETRQNQTDLRHFPDCTLLWTSGLPWVSASPLWAFTSQLWSLA